jgi:hypothetical protein
MIIVYQLGLLINSVIPFVLKAFPHFNGTVFLMQYINSNCFNRFKVLNENLSFEYDNVQNASCISNTV